MRYGSVGFNKRVQSSTDLEKALNNAFSYGEVVSFECVPDLDSNDVTFVFLINETSSVRYTAKIFGIAPASFVGMDMSMYVEAQGNDKKYKAINLLPMGSQRALGVVVTTTEKAAEAVSRDGTVESKRKRATKKQDKRVDAGSDTLAESGLVTGDATDDADGA